MPHQGKDQGITKSKPDTNHMAPVSHLTQSRDMYSCTHSFIYSFVYQFSQQISVKYLLNLSTDRPVLASVSHVRPHAELDPHGDWCPVWPWNVRAGAEISVECQILCEALGVQMRINKTHLLRYSLWRAGKLRGDNNMRERWCNRGFM